MAAPDECARILLEITPLVMRSIRKELRSHRAPDLSVPQFRILFFLNRNASSSLSALAEHIGLTLPSMSKMVDGLVGRALVLRRECPSDRRKVTLSLTEEGKRVLEAARESAQNRLSEQLSALSGSQRAAIIEAMLDLQRVFTSEPPPNRG